jgi:hypothetical protein
MTTSCEAKAASALNRERYTVIIRDMPARAVGELTKRSLGRVFCRGGDPAPINSRSSKLWV